MIAIGFYLAKTAFQAHLNDLSRRAVPRKTLRRDQTPVFPGRLQPCASATKACGNAKVWGRQIGKPGRVVRLIPATQVTAFGKRQ